MNDHIPFISWAMTRLEVTISGNEGVSPEDEGKNVKNRKCPIKLETTCQSNKGEIYY